MSRRFWLLISLLLVVLAPGLAQAQEPEPKHSAPYWQVSYWNNTTFSGEPVTFTSASRAKICTPSVWRIILRCRSAGPNKTPRLDGFSNVMLSSNDAPLSRSLPVRWASGRIRASLKDSTTNG